MKSIKYKVKGYTDEYNATTGQIDRREIFAVVTLPWSEANEENAKKEAHNGEYVIADDGAEEVTTPTIAERVEALEEALLEMVLEG